MASVEVLSNFYLVAKTQSHYGDEEAKESFKFPQAYKETHCINRGMHSFQDKVYVRVYAYHICLERGTQMCL